MRTLGWSIVAVTACSSPPNTCDQHVVDELAAIGYLSAPYAPTVPGPDKIVPLACDSGTASMDIGPTPIGWRATFTFDACTIGNPKLLTLTGTMSYANNVNDDDSGGGTALTIVGTVDACPEPIDETCDLTWGSKPKEPRTNYNYYRTGTLCDREFP